jgi:hypothetical protein
MLILKSRNLAEFGDRPFDLLRAVLVAGDDHLLGAAGFGAAEIDTFLDA